MDQHDEFITNPGQNNYYQLTELKLFEKFNEDNSELFECFGFDN